jgi:hypothetical protein
MRLTTFHEQERQNDSEKDVKTGGAAPRVTAEMMCEGRCPLCRTPLVVRMDCLGPYFACLCHPRRRP